MLRDALRRPAEFAPPPADLRPQLPDVARLLTDRQGDDEAKRKPAAERAALLRRLRQTGFDWQRVDPADRLSVAWVLWEGPDPPAEHPEFLTAFLAWLDAPWRRVQATRVAAAWAAGFDSTSVGTCTAAEWLAARASDLLPPWPDLARRFDIFSTARAPAALAEAFLASRAAPAVFFAQLGLRGVSGLLVEMLAAAATLAMPRLGTRPYLTDRLIDLARFQASDSRREKPEIDPARIRTTHARIAEALLLAWSDAPPPDDIRADIAAYLLREHGDPRRRRDGWRGVAGSAVGTMRDWLRRTTIAAFFAAGEEATGLAATSWRMRRDFWLSCADCLDAAWIVAGTRRRAALTAGGLGCGRLIGCRPDDKALLLRLKGVTIVETGHLGPTFVWRPDNPLTPPLDPQVERLYTLPSLTAGADFALRERPADGALRREQLETFIALHTGLAAA
ncbi:MAG TPA: EH signature domain-containing protein [Stellaceae bacterium]|nr:EH signature domain-containing protein [Stellaceae bacterium]